MTRFNQGKFNISGAGAIKVIGTASVKVGIDTSYKLNKEQKDVEARIDLATSGAPTLIKFARAEANEQVSDIAVRASLRPTVRTFQEGVAAAITILADSKSSTLGVDVIESSWKLLLRPGETMEIDLCDLTATIDGANALHMLKNMTEWFDFAAGENEITVYTDGQASISIYWKDRWLS